MMTVSPTPPDKLPTSKWLFDMLTLDVWSRMDYLDAHLKSTHGRIIKIDSTVKVNKMLV